MKNCSDSNLLEKDILIENYKIFNAEKAALEARSYNVIFFCLTTIVGIVGFSLSEKSVGILSSLPIVASIGGAILARFAIGMQLLGFKIFQIETEFRDRGVSRKFLGMTTDIITGANFHWVPGTIAGIVVCIIYILPFYLTLDGSLLDTSELFLEVPVRNIIITFDIIFGVLAITFWGLSAVLSTKFKRQIRQN